MKLTLDVDPIRSTGCCLGRAGGWRCLAEEWDPLVSAWVLLWALAKLKLAKHNDKKFCDLLGLCLLGKAFFAEFRAAFCCTKQIRPHVGTEEGQ